MEKSSKPSMRNKLADMIYAQLRFRKVTKKDLWFMMKNFIDRELYERCSVIKELLDLQFYDPDAVSYYGIYSEQKRIAEKNQADFHEMERLIKSGEMVVDVDRKYAGFGQVADCVQQRMRELWSSLEMKDGVMLDIPFKNKRNLDYLFE